MTETEFLQHSDALFTHIETALDDSDLDCETAGNVLTITADDGTQIIVNRHTPNQELWIAAKSGGYHLPTTTAHGWQRATNANFLPC